jgi:iron complex transport system substrate-binding protein
LGLQGDLVARSHECDFPPGVERLPVCTGPKFDVQGSSGDIDRDVKRLLQDATSVYFVDADKLRDLRPDFIVTQTQCEVCAVSQRDVEDALCSWIDSRPRIISLSPNNLADVWADIERVAEALGRPQVGHEVVQGLKERCARIEEQSRKLAARPSIACLEWLEPLMAAGNWVPELVARAGGENLFGEAGKHSPWMTWEELVARDPDLIVALPCGFDMERTTAEMHHLTGRPGWQDLRAVQAGKVFVADGNQYFNRPGPRLVESLEILAELLHPEAFRFGHEGTGWRKFGHGRGEPRA